MLYLVIDAEQKILLMTSNRTEAFEEYCAYNEMFAGTYPSCIIVGGHQLWGDSRATKTIEEQEEKPHYHQWFIDED